MRGFYISYSDCRDNPFDDILTMLGGMRAENKHRPETAIVYSDEGKRLGKRHLILYGDWRNQLAAVAPQGLTACIRFFEAHIQHVSDTSDLPPRSLN